MDCMGPPHRRPLLAAIQEEVLYTMCLTRDIPGCSETRATVYRLHYMGHALYLLAKEGTKCNFADS